MEEGNIIVAGKYRIIRKVGSGSFGTVYLGTNQSTGDDVAVKVESHNSEPQQLLYEARILKELQGGLGIPVLYWSGVMGNYNVMVLELLGPCLETLLSQCHHKFSMKTVCQLAGQMLKRLEYVHEQSFVHRDMKPENFLIGTSKKTSIVHIIDFGLSKKYRDGKTHQHIPYREGKSLTGTARYASVNSHLGLELSRRDDVESLGYIIVYFFKGTLPWQGMRGNTKQEKYNKILEKKMAVAPHVLCKGCPDVFAQFLTYCKGLQFEERPDYTYATNLFVELGIKHGFTFDRVFDWTEALASTHVHDRPGKSLGSSHNGKKPKQAATLSNRRKSEIISKDTMKELIRKKTISEHGSDTPNSSSVATFVNKDCGPYLKAKTRLALNGLNSAEKAKLEEKKSNCALF